MSVDLVGFVKLVGVGYGFPRLKYVVQAMARGLATTFLRFSRGGQSIATVGRNFTCIFYMRMN